MSEAFRSSNLEIEPDSGVLRPVHPANVTYLEKGSLNFELYRPKVPVPSRLCNYAQCFFWQRFEQYLAY